jgi:hypothetical protein
LAAPYLPVPRGPLLSGFIPTTLLPQLVGTGRLFYFPDTYPIPSRDQLRQLLDDSLHGGEPPEHLKEWMGFIDQKNPAKNKIARFARLVELQHYWKALLARHAAALDGNQERLVQALASFLKVSEDTIQRDLRLLQERLELGKTQHPPAPSTF